VQYYATMPVLTGNKLVKSYPAGALLH